MEQTTKERSLKAGSIEIPIIGKKKDFRTAMDEASSRLKADIEGAMGAVVIIVREVDKKRMIDFTMPDGMRDTDLLMILEKIKKVLVG